MPRNDAEQRHECADIANKGMNLDQGNERTRVCVIVDVHDIMSRYDSRAWQLSGSSRNRSGLRNPEYSDRLVRSERDSALA